MSGGGGLLKLWASQSIVTSQQRPWSLRGQCSQYRKVNKDQAVNKVQSYGWRITGMPKAGSLPLRTLLSSRPWWPPKEAQPLMSKPPSHYPVICWPHKIAHYTDVKGGLLGFELQSAPSSFYPLVPVFPPRTVWTKSDPFSCDRWDRYSNQWQGQ